MIFRETELPGAYVIQPEPIEDERGFFARLFDEDEFNDRGLERTFVQWSISHNERAGTLRGMHFQTPPHDEVKLVRVTSGALYDVIVDLRPGSPAFKRWTALELTAQNRLALYIPKGFAHGFQTLEDATEVFYAISASYEPSASGGVRWDDPLLGIEWPPSDRRIISEKDRSWPDFTS
jgi:dTDP-4-dehydrorhamnose 3,5-epimerase